MTTLADQMRTELLRLMPVIPSPEEDSMFSSPRCRWCQSMFLPGHPERHDKNCFAVRVLGQRPR